ncbi:hypothetical protein COV11_02370 [Candidatus Woesearchaeota archaeon CG10_big_fil_rev_8_21_14_0_10_30_7]|nr:MAG: hypothetical protein COV11_02370 [Candidatus Woesearchaeota archaeon CG10_big_fil_rev_8_21_14_0_10_30_7]
MTVEDSLEELHAKLDKLVDLFSKAIDKFDKVLDKVEDSSTDILSEKMDEVLDQNAQIADGIVALSEMVKDLHAVKNHPSEPHMNFSEPLENLEGPRLPPPLSPRKKLFKK